MILYEVRCDGLKPKRFKRFSSAVNAFEYLCFHSVRFVELYKVFIEPDGLEFFQILNCN